jgi:hypothetical protein
MSDRLNYVSLHGFFQDRHACATFERDGETWRVELHVDQKAPLRLTLPATCKPCWTVAIKHIKKTLCRAKPKAVRKKRQSVASTLLKIIN